MGEEEKSKENTSIGGLSFSYHSQKKQVEEMRDPYQSQGTRDTDIMVDKVEDKR